ncbi:DUF1496 domain-containing protein [Erwinia psidii]|uniref:DUF1496 domain-containing protein n=1 Tax=Erwinia psidii TaxID=69224 RepID=A0A3N6SIM3_9GAMM|nr:DUF1496 domain-containing protein [Erwinia psidii]MCX8955905.1 DUF1496 domain-containing protein [Erwinia psidii]MCX8961277.1 DUF1496 domain-containing protein [Erwinia psidii]MCX8966454.1 DUF1496 domain-containing protein [Erwinia psidii]RQM38621.1 DUF1496 domain-containing protein [Erwinia psidii]
MITKSVMMVSVLLFCAQPLVAAEQSDDVSVGEVNGTNDGGSGYSSNASRGNVVVDMPPEAWTRGQHGNQPPCQRCCTYEDRSYTEGSVVKMDGVLLQCVRDEHSFGTNNLVWKALRQ